MTEMDLLTRLRDEVPLTDPSPNAQRAFRAGVADGGRVRRPRLRARFFHARTTLIAGATAVAVGVATGGVVLALPSAHQSPTASPRASTQTVRATPTGTAVKIAGTTKSAQLLADTAANVVLSQPAVKSNQWVYRKMEYYFQPIPKLRWHRPHAYMVENVWMMADGARFTTTGPVVGLMDEAPVSYGQLDSLPTNPVALDAYIAHLSYPSPHATTQNKATAEFSGVAGLLTSYVLPPKLTAELFHALADIPTVFAKKNVKDIAGQVGVAFITPANGQSVNQEIVLSPTSYRVLGRAGWQADVIPMHGEAFLAQAFVSGPGKLP